MRKNIKPQQSNNSSSQNSTSQQISATQPVSGTKKKYSDEQERSARISLITKQYHLTDEETKLKDSQIGLVIACRNLGIPYKIWHKANLLVEVKLEKPLFFFKHFKAFDSEDIARLCKDKDLSYTLLKDVVKLPKWESYLDPNCSETFRHLVEFDSHEKIADHIEKKFTYPVIIKRNTGSQGHNVFLAKNRAEIINALGKIYDRTDMSLYDYIAIAQQSIDIAHEYRVLTYKDEIMFAYEKDISQAVFDGNLSPLHWINAKAILIKDTPTLASFKDFILPVHKRLQSSFIGFDIAVDRSGIMWLLEINKSPGLGHFVKDNGLDEVIKMFEKILSRYPRSTN